MAEEPTPTPEPDVPEPPQPEPAPEEEPEEAEGEPVTAVEPRPSLGEFASLANVSGPARKALETWMRMEGLDASGNYPLTEWQAHYASMLAST